MTDPPSPALHGADSHDLIRVQGARVNNLKVVSAELPKRRLTVFIGVASSSKSSLAPKYSGGRPPKFTVAEHRAIRKIDLGHPTDHGEPFATWSLTKLADQLVRKGVLEDILCFGEDGVPTRRDPR